MYCNMICINNKIFQVFFLETELNFILLPVCLPTVPLQNCFVTYLNSTNPQSNAK